MCNTAMAVEPVYSGHYGLKISGCNRQRGGCFEEVCDIMELCLTQVTTIVTQVRLEYTRESSNYVMSFIRLRNGCEFSITLTLVTVEIHLDISEEDNAVS